jgi:acyl-CoA thioesterase FadM
MPSGSVRTSALLRYAQDCAWAHSERLGFGRDWYAERGLFWLVRAVELRLSGTLPTGATAAVTTRIVGFRHVLARRLTTIVGPTGSPVASIDTDWAMVGDDGVPTRIPAEFPALLGGAGSPFRPHRVVLPSPGPREAGETVERSGLSFRVRPQELDPMGHANNAVHLDWLEEALAADTVGRLGSLLARSPRAYRLEYLLPARPQVDLRAEAWRSGASSAAYRLREPGGDLLHATIEA